MKRALFCACCVVLICASLPAFAGTPSIGIGDPDCSSWKSFWGPIVDITSGSAFSFAPNSSGGGMFGFCNKTGTLWTSVDIKFVSSSITSVNCTSDVFGTITGCTGPDVNGVWDLNFSNPTNNFGGIPGGPGPGGQFYLSINLNTDGCVPQNKNDTSCGGTAGSLGGGDWPEIRLFGGVNAPAVLPEPASVLLVGAGVGAWFMSRRRRRK